MIHTRFYSITMSGTPSLTILSEEQKFNGENLLQWKTNMFQLLASKGLSGYIDGKIQKPEPESIPIPDTPSNIIDYYYFYIFKYANHQSMDVSRSTSKRPYQTKW